MSAISQYQVKLDQTREKLVKLEERCQSFVNDLQVRRARALNLLRVETLTSRYLTARFRTSVEGL